jgi:uncharacterized membrane protein YkvA (DUF1232 family)
LEYGWAACLHNDIDSGEFRLIAKLKNYAAFIKKESYALTIAVRDPRVPWYARVLLGVLLAYAFSPIDLIPDFIPVLGYLDDLIIVPLGITLALRMIPAQVMIDARKQAEDSLQHGKPVSRVGAIIIILAWLLILAAAIWFFVRTLRE